MVTPYPLPARIVIPVANPSTAEELVRLGADLLDPRAGELTALGIVEVPAGMGLSQGAPRPRPARPARRGPARPAPRRDRPRHAPRAAGHHDRGSDPGGARPRIRGATAH